MVKCAVCKSFRDYLFNLIDLGYIFSASSMDAHLQLRNKNAQYNWMKSNSFWWKKSLIVWKLLKYYKDDLVLTVKFFIVMLNRKSLDYIQQIEDTFKNDCMKPLTMYSLSC